jgi:parallel beta-helix repeat protein
VTIDHAILQDLIVGLDSNYQVAGRNGHLSVSNSTFDNSLFSVTHLAEFVDNTGTCRDGSLRPGIDAFFTTGDTYVAGNSLTGCQVSAITTSDVAILIENNTLLQESDISVEGTCPAACPINQAAARVTIRHNLLPGLFFDGIVVRKISGPVQIEANRAAAIRLYNVVDLPSSGSSVRRVERNVLSQALELANVAHARIRGNVVACPPSPVSGGIQVWGTGGDFQTMHNEIVDNRVSGCPVGLSIQDASHNTLRGNIFMANQVGADVLAMDNLFYNNRFQANALNLRVTPGCADGQCANTWNVAKQAGTNAVGGPFLGGNYWSDYAGADDDGDGLGDTPYVGPQANAANTDYLPLVAVAGPDLLVDAVRLRPGDVYYDAGRYLLPIEATVANYGTQDAGGFVLRFEGDDLWDEAVVAGLAAGERIAVALVWDVTAPLLPTGKGTLRLAVQADANDEVAEMTDANNRWAGAAALDVQPRISQVEAGYLLAGSRYLLAGDVPNPIRVYADWNGDLAGRGGPPYGEVIFELNGSTTNKPAASWGATHRYNMGSDLLGTFSCPNNVLNVWLTYPTAAGDYKSQITTFQPSVLPLPDWVKWVPANIPGNDAELDTTLEPPLVAYAYDFRYPEPPYEALWTPPNWVPYLGGQEMGITESLVGTQVLGRSDGWGQIGGQGALGWAAAGFSAGGRLSAQGEARLACGESLALEKARVEMSMDARVEPEMRLIDLLPGLQSAEGWNVVGRFVKWLNRLTTVRATLVPRVDVTTVFEERDGALAFVPDGTRGQGEMKVAATLGVEMDEDLAIDVTGGGTPHVQLQVPAPYLAESGIDLYFDGRLKAYSFEAPAQRRVHCAWGGTCVDYDGGGGIQAPDWRPIPRHYDGPAYARFVAPQTPPSLAAGAVTTETTLLNNIYSYPQPSLAVSGSLRLLAYVHDDTGQPQGLGTHIRAMAYDGSTWHPPVDLTPVDSQPDYSPAAALMAGGSGLVVWEQSSIAAEPLALDPAFARSLDVVACKWTGSTCGPLTNLSNSPAWMDHAPQLATTHDGLQAMALWRTNDGTDVLGTPAQPITLTYALWDGAAWSAPAPAQAGLYDLIDVAFAAHAGDRAALVYVRDMDGDLENTLDDTELFYSTYDGLAWSGPAQLTDDGGGPVPDVAPALAYDAGGRVHLVWLRGGDLVWLHDAWDPSQAQTIRPAGREGGLMGATLSSAADGNLALVWQGSGDGAADLVYRVYDGATGEWAADQKLTAGLDLERAHSLALGTTGEIFLAYQKTGVELVTQTIEVSPTLRYTVIDLPVRGQSDLAFLEHTIGRDLLFDSLHLAPANPAPGQAVTLTAVLRNGGDLTVAAPGVAFYDGYAAISGTQTLADLGGGMTATVQAVWTVPEGSTARTVRAEADPAALVTETDEANNEISLSTVLPDLAADWTYVAHDGGTLQVHTRLVNRGASDVMAPFDVALWLDDPLTGTLVLSTTVDHYLAAGEALSLTQTLSDPASLAGQGHRLWLVADTGQAVVEADEGNNARWAPFQIGPDLALRAPDLAGEGPLYVTVHNEGLIAASGVGVEVRSGGLGGALLYGGSLAYLPASSSGTLTVPLPADSYRLYVRVDPANAIAEMDESNNLAVRDLDLAWHIYLPLVMR